MVRRWRKDQANLFNRELELSAKQKTMGCFTPKYPELDQRLLEWFSEQRSHGKNFPLIHTVLLLGKCRFKQEEIHLLLGVMFSLASLLVAFDIGSTQYSTSSC